MSNKRVIELTQDIDNPQVDRRSKDWHKLPELKAGERFLIWQSRDGYDVIQHVNTYRIDYGHVPVLPKNCLGKRIVDNSKEVEPQGYVEMTEVYAPNAAGPEEVLRILIKLGRIGKDDFAAANEVPEDF